MRAREYGASALRPAAGSMCVVMACSDMREADQVGRCLSELNTGCLVTYMKAEDILRSAPRGRVALMILAARDSAQGLRKTLRWLRNRWPGCPLTVVGDAGGGEYELAARQGGAMFLARPVRSEDWMAVLTHALRVGQVARDRAVPESTTG